MLESIHGGEWRVTIDDNKATCYLIDSTPIRKFDGVRNIVLIDGEKILKQFDFSIDTDVELSDNTLHQILINF